MLFHKTRFWFAYLKIGIKFRLESWKLNGFCKEECGSLKRRGLLIWSGFFLLCPGMDWNHLQENEGSFHQHRRQMNLTSSQKVLKFRNKPDWTIVIFFLLFQREVYKAILTCICIAIYFRLFRICLKVLTTFWHIYLEL